MEAHRNAVCMYLPCMTDSQAGQAWVPLHRGSALQGEYTVSMVKKQDYQDIVVRRFYLYTFVRLPPPVGA